MPAMIAPGFHWLFLAAFCASAFGGALGMASGIFIVPILTLLFGLDIRVAIGASIKNCVDLAAVYTAGSTNVTRNACNTFTLSGPFVQLNPAQLFMRDISIRSVKSTSLAQLKDCLQMVKLGQVKPVITDRLPLEGAVEAHRAVENGRSMGRILLKPSL